MLLWNNEIYIFKNCGQNIVGDPQLNHDCAFGLKDNNHSQNN